MSVCNVTRRYDNSGSNEAQRNNLLYEVARRQFTVSYNVQCTSHLDGPSVIMASPLVPKLGHTFAFGNDRDDLATCVKVNVPKRLGRRRWVVEYNYDTDRIVAEFTDNPFQQPPEISGGTIPYEIAMRRDALGRPIVNTARRPFDPPPTIDEKAGVFTIVRNEAISTAQAAFYLPKVVPVFTRAKADRFRMKCNSVTWQTYGTYIARMNEIRFQRQLSFGRLFWQVTYEIEVRPLRKFYTYLLDMSWTDKDDKVFRDPATGMPLQNQTLLNGRGDPLKLAKTKLLADINGVETDLIVDNEPFLKYFPEPKAFEFQNFFIRVDDEIMEVLAYGPEGTLSVFNVTRGVEGSKAVAHATNAVVTMEPYYLRFSPHLTDDFNVLALPELP